MLKFPAVNIDFEKWDTLDDAVFLFDEFIYTDDTKLFNVFFHNQEFVDCSGRIYKVTGVQLPEEYWRYFFKFLPNVYKCQLIFKYTGQTMSTQELKDSMVFGIKKAFGDSVLTRNWIEKVNQQPTIEQILNLESG